MAARCAAESAAIHRHGRHDAAKRQHGLDALTRRQDVVDDTEADSVTEEMTHRAPWCIERCLISPRRVEPGAMRAGDVAFEIGHGSDHRRPGLGRRVRIGTIIATRVESEAAEVMQIRDATLT